MSVMDDQVHIGKIWSGIDTYSGGHWFARYKVLAGLPGIGNGFLRFGKRKRFSNLFNDRRP